MSIRSGLGPGSLGTTGRTAPTAGSPGDPAPVPAARQPEDAPAFASQGWFAVLVETLETDFRAAEFLGTFVTGCAQVLGLDAAVFLAERGGTLELAATSGPSAKLLARTELGLPENAAAQCLRARGPVSRYGSVPAPGGMYSAHALPMRLREEFLGVLTLYRLDGNRLDADLYGLAQSLADAATISLLHKRSMLALDVRAAQLQSALDTRVLIEQAKGVLAERLELSPDEAFGLLRGYARAHNRKLRDCAAEVVAGKLRVTRPETAAPPGPAAPAAGPAAGEA